MKNYLRIKGQASLIMVLLVGLVAVTSAIASSSLSTSNVLVEETINSTETARAAAWAGVDELMLRLRARQNFGANYSINLDLGSGSTVSATITGDNNQKTIIATGYASGIIRNLEVKVASSSSKASFIFAAQSGTGGFELESTTVVTGANGTDGNIYSNGDVLGQSSSSGSSGSRVMGSIWATGNIGGLGNPSTGGVYIKKNAWANSETACYVGGTVKSPAPPSNCNHGGAYTISDPPPAQSLNTVDSDYWKNIAQSGTIWNGNCNVKSGNATDCTNGTGNLGNMKIIGNLSANNGVTMKFTGPVWVKGNITLSNNVIVNTDNALGTTSVVVVASDPDNLALNGKIATDNNTVFNKNSSGAGPIFISENTSIDCNLPAIAVSNNAATVVLIAIDGCINVGNNAVMNGIIGKKIHLQNNSTINYDPSLARAIVEPNSGGWAVLSVREY